MPVVVYTADMSSAQFKSQYAAKTVSALSNVTGVPGDNITVTVKALAQGATSNKPATAATAGRKLLQPADSASTAGAGGVQADYALVSDDPLAALDSLVRSTRDRGLYSSLATAGVPGQPVVSIGSTDSVVLDPQVAAISEDYSSSGLGSVPSTSGAATSSRGGGGPTYYNYDLTAAPPGSSNSSSGGDGLQHGNIINVPALVAGLVVGGGGVIALVALGIWCCIRHQRRHLPVKKGDGVKQVVAKPAYPSHEVDHRLVAPAVTATAVTPGSVKDIDRAG